MAKSDRKKPGRPRTRPPVSFLVFCERSERAAMKRQAKAAGVSLSELVRRRILGVPN